MVTLGNVLDGGQKNQHRGAELPHAQGNQGAQRGLGVAQPGGAVRQTEEAQHLIENASGGEQLLPQQGDGNAAAHQGGNVERGAVEAGQSGRAGQHQRDEQCDRQLDGHLNQCKLESDFEGRPEQIILKEHLLEVVKAHPLGGGQDVVVGEGQVQRGEKGNGGEHDQTDDKGENKDIACNIVPIKPAAELVGKAVFLFHGNGSFHGMWGDSKNRAEGEDLRRDQGEENF